jgi:amidohydrolase
MDSEKHLFANLDAVAARAVEIRHELHRHPELGYQEVFTSALICRELDTLGIQYTRGWAGGTGIVALIPGGAGDGKCVALRADMDALPILEETGAAYASTIPGVMHACGHDGHVAVLLGTAALLKARAGHLPGTVKLLFQPAEEGGLGAEKMCAEGALDKPRVDAIFGLHGWPGLKVGMVGTRAGPLLASVDGFRIVVSGRGGHAASPQDCIDPLVCAAACVTALQTIISREVDPNDAAVVTVSQIAGGAAFNVIPDRVEMNGTIRALSDIRHRALIDSIERVCRGVADAHRCAVSFEYYGTTPVTSNTPALADFIAKTAAAALGEQAFIWAPRPAMWGEDFAFYLKHVPGCFFVLGVQPMEVDSYPMLHNPRFDFTDAAVAVGIRMMVSAAVGFLKD